MVLQKKKREARDYYRDTASEPQKRRGVRRARKVNRTRELSLSDQDREGVREPAIAKTVRR